MDSWVPIALLAGLLAALFGLERLVPLREPTRPLAGRLWTNAAIAGSGLAAAGAIVQPAVSGLLAWTEETATGLLHFTELPRPLEVGAGFVLLDLTFYYWHRATHRVGFLWRFHAVHHIDPDLDVTTAPRFHPGEVVLSLGFRAAQVGLLGVSPLTYLAYELIYQAGTQLHHSNIRFPVGLERVLNLLLVTPRMHGIHHSQIRSEANSNYSVVFSWWDRLHRTIRLNVPQRQVVVGVPACGEARDNGVLAALAMPFRAQRDYWQLSEGERLLHRRGYEARSGVLAA